MVEKIVSGAQTGADRAALDVGLALGIAIGGWVPRGRKAEDGVVPQRYAELVETDSDDYAVRTAWNVRDSDATLIFTFGALHGGTALTHRIAMESQKAVLVVDFEETSLEEASSRVRDWLVHERPAVLNVAGPRASHESRITDATARVLRNVLVGIGRGVRA